MPLEQRVIEPVFVSRSTLPLPNLNVANDLECVTNGSLANVIRQLSTLSRKAEDLLSGVSEDANMIMSRTIELQHRMDRLLVKVVNKSRQENTNEQALSLHDASYQRDSFASDMSYNQQVLNRQTMPASIAELYQACDAPPPLNKLDPYRDDGKDGLRFYTDPNYFFRLWKRDMLKETMKAQQAQQRAVSQYQQQQLQKQQVLQQKQSHNSTPYQHQIPQPMSEHLLQSQSQVHPHLLQQASHPSMHQQQPTQHQQLQQQQQQQQQQHLNHNNYDNSQTSLHSQHHVHPPPPPPQQHHHSRVTLPPPPPPPPPSETSGHQQGPSQSLPPPPPPPPPPTQSAPAPPPPPPPPPEPAHAPTQAVAVTTAPSGSVLPPTAAQLQMQQQQLRKTTVHENQRSVLLAAIREGVKLRRVHNSEKKEADRQTLANDVASILARRVAIELSDSEDEDEEDNDRWADDSEC